MGGVIAHGNPAANGMATRVLDPHIDGAAAPTTDRDRQVVGVASVVDPQDHGLCGGPVAKRGLIPLDPECKEKRKQHYDEQWERDEKAAPP